ncbi:MAG: CPBP family intramembrane metalloprotease [Lachnospiraceae bacterium]|nr:CPBP family intramembrane metalloprotease [Ruminococcus sp.]MCM1276010.1 CPBP family intramembrane metalloprotease [Lachnospiraceae bacterium]
MSEEIIETKPQAELPIEPIEPTEPSSLLPGFKSMCFRIGVMMIIVFAARIIVNIISALIVPYLSGLSLTPTAAYLIDAAVSVVFLYIIPITAAVFLLKRPMKNRVKQIYAKPKYFGRAMAMFPAGYGIAITCNLLTQLLGLLFRNTALGDSFTGIQETLAAPDVGSAVVLFIQLTVLAPIFEEFWCRGLIIESLRPYGNGFAIFVSALLFGIIHANFAQFFYAFALGIFLGYIYVSTQSLVTTTVMHAMFNSISGMMILLGSIPSVQEYLLAAADGGEPVVTPAAVLYIVWMAMTVLLLVVGIIMAIYKFTKIKKYRVPKVQTELSTVRRWGIFLSRISVIVMLLLAADTFAAQWIPRFFVKLVTGSWD